MFRKIILALSIILCIAPIGCSNHDEPTEPTEALYPSGMYIEGNSLWKLVLTVNGQPTSGKSVRIGFYENYPSLMVLHDIVPDKSECRIPIEISVERDGEDYSYHFSGEYSYKKNRTLRYDGVITDPYGFLSQAVLTLDIEL